MFIKKGIILFLCIWSVSILGQTNIKSMFYNVLNYDANTESRSRTPHLKKILEATLPDLFMICELKSESASNYLFENAILPVNAKFKKADFKNSKSPATGLLQMVYYNSDKLTLKSSNVIPTRVRDINHYTFTINTENTENTEVTKIEVFVTHLKASRGEDNRVKRLESIEYLLRELEEMSPDSFVLFAGDFNFYTSNEEGFLKITNSNNKIKIVDPINRLCPTFPDDTINYFNEYRSFSQYFWNNTNFSDVHSQSTRSTTLNDGAGGGMDDRFDFILMSESLKTNSKLYYKNGSYKTIGNNGNCYNFSVNNTNCSGSFSKDLRNALYAFSDHLPVVLELETPKNTLSQENFNPISFLNSNISSEKLVLKMKHSGYKKLLIFNQLGIKIKQISIENLSEIHININFLSKGIYYVKIDTHKPKRFIKI